MALVLCQGCQRHVRASESACPFCKSAIAASVEHTEVEGPAGRVTRSHVTGFVVGAVAVSSVLFGTACPMYGGPGVEIPRDSGSGNNDAR
jgi:hypothetical protein